MLENKIIDISRYACSKEDFSNVFDKSVSRIDSLHIGINKFYKFNNKSKETLTAYLQEGIEQGHSYMAIEGDIRMFYKDVIYSKSGTIVILETVDKTITSKVNMIGGVFGQ